MESQRTFRFSQRIEFQRGSETRMVIEATEGRIDRMIAANDQPLTPIREKQEQERLSKFLLDKTTLEKEISEQRVDDARRELLIANLPNAFILTFSCMDAGGRLKFSFSPNPRFYPKSRETQILTGMQGWLWIDPISERIAEIEGELFRDVNFGWGILGRLYKGGRFKVVQSEISPGVWRITTLNVDFTGKVMLFKSLRIFQKQTVTGFVAIPSGTNARRAVEELLSYRVSN